MKEKQEIMDRINPITQIENHNVQSGEVIEKGMAGNIPVYCSYDQIVPLKDIHPNPQNPNTHSKEQIQILTNAIKKQGWRSPITVSERSGLVVKGHGRLLAAYETGENMAPVDYQYYDSDEAEKADLLADNKIAELSEIDESLLTEMLQELTETDFEMLLTGYSEEEIENLLNPSEPSPDAMEQETVVQKYELVIVCPNEVEMDDLYVRLIEQHLAVEKKVTQIL